MKTLSVKGVLEQLASTARGCVQRLVGRLRVARLKADKRLTRDIRIACAMAKTNARLDALIEQLERGETICDIKKKKALKNSDRVWRVCKKWRWQ